MGRWWLVVATPGGSPDPRPGDTEHWPGAGSQCGAPETRATILGPSEASRPPGPAVREAAARDELLMKVGSGSECACHHSYPVPSDHPLMGSINTGDHMHKH